VRLPTAQAPRRIQVRPRRRSPKTKLGYNPIYGYGYYYPLEPRGASGREPTTTDLGIHANYALDHEHNYELGVIDPPQRWIDNGINPCPTCANPDFGKTTVFQAPDRSGLQPGLHSEARS